MRTKIYFTAIACFSAVAIAGCGSAGNTSVSVNRTGANATANTAVVTNSNANTGSSISNSVSNAVSSVTTTSPNDFMMEAAADGMTEVELGKLAASKATNVEVKKFAQMIVTDHTKANAELKALAAKKSVTLPTTLDSSHQSTIDNMKGKSGADFDADYVDAMVEDHEDDVAAFEKQAQSSSDPDVKAFAAKTLPTLRSHMEAIKAIQAKMK